MATKTPQNGKASGGHHTTTVTTIHGQHLRSAEKRPQVFSTLRTTNVFKGSDLPPDDLVSCWAERWGLVRYLHTIDAARRFIEQVGGRL